MNRTVSGVQSCVQGRITMVAKGATRLGKGRSDSFQKERKGRSHWFGTGKEKRKSDAKLEPTTREDERIAGLI